MRLFKLASFWFAIESKKRPAFPVGFFDVEHLLLNHVAVNRRWLPTLLFVGCVLFEGTRFGAVHRETSKEPAFYFKTRPDCVSPLLVNLLGDSHRANVCHHHGSIDLTSLLIANQFPCFSLAFPVWSAL